MDGYTITPLRLGTITRKKSNMVYGADNTPLDFPLIAFLLEGFGRKLLVDTGGSPPTASTGCPTPAQSARPCRRTGGRRNNAGGDRRGALYPPSLGPRRQ